MRMPFHMFKTTPPVNASVAQARPRAAPLSPSSRGRDETTAPAQTFNVRRSPTPNSSFLTLPSDQGKRPQAFTLIEMLIVISIISVLLGLLYGSLERARTFSRRAIAYTEVKNIEAAFKQYYAHYHDWPPENFFNAATALSPAPTGNDNGFIIDATAATMLQGTISDNTTPAAIKEANPDRIPFIEFARKNNNSVPINPFRLVSSTETRQYKVLFDLDNDSMIQVVESSANFQTNVYASVAVWTVIPGSTSSSQNNGTQTATDEVLGSWDTFSK
jgi:prepilin-type N-terminal cleavage/methylation domain-containing protein